MGRTPLTPAPVAPHTADFYAIEAHSMLELERPRHPRLRGLVLRAFTSRRIRELQPEIEEICASLLDRMKGESRADLLDTYARPLPVIVIARLLGVPEEMADQLLDWSNAMVAMYQARRNRAVEVAANIAARDFADFMRTHIDRRRATPADDLITHLIAAEEDGERLTTDELITTCILLLNAGHEATVHTLGNGVKTLLETGTGEGGLTPDRIETTVEEILRYDPPLHMFTRHVYEDLELFGQTFSRGDEIACLLGAANRDPAQWAEPERFDPSRKITMNSAFGAGVHFCVGAPLARLELVVALPALFARFPAIRLAEAPRYANLYHFHGLEGLLVDL
jgi:cytochrome P450